MGKVEQNVIYVDNAGNDKNTGKNTDLAKKTLINAIESVSKGVKVSIIAHDTTNQDAPIVVPTNVTINAPQTTVISETDASSELTLQMILLLHLKK